jgi:hypothetical protein
MTVMRGENSGQMLAGGRCFQSLPSIRTLIRSNKEEHLGRHLYILVEQDSL